MRVAEEVQAPARAQVQAAGHQAPLISSTRSRAAIIQAAVREVKIAVAPQDTTLSLTNPRLRA
jgi:hypothetical protein